MKQCVIDRRRAPLLARILGCRRAARRPRCVRAQETHARGSDQRVISPRSPLPLPPPARKASNPGGEAGWRGASRSKNNRGLIDGREVWRRGCEGESEDMIGRMQIKARTPLDAGSGGKSEGRSGGCEVEGYGGCARRAGRGGAAVPGELEVAATRVRIVS